MPKLIFSILLAITLSGCLAKTSTTSFSGPSGKSLFKTKCNVDTSKCFAEASSKCGGSYNVINSESHAGGTLADILPGPVTWYGMTYESGPSNGQYPKFAFQGQRPSSSSNNTIIIKNCANKSYGGGFFGGLAKGLDGC
ncbi:hypothetical protein OAT42_04375 [Alphaproteobacteria bacterium]|nr:hypothetical protein [Alphaproteobacteria bacterium]